MANLMTGGVMSGLISASTNMKSAQVSASVYHKAKIRNDDAGMERASGYMTDFAKEARNAVQKSNEALLESTQTVQQPEQVEKTTTVNPANREQDIANNDKLSQEIEAANNQILNPVDTVEISPESVAALQAASAEDENTQQIAPVAEDETAPQDVPEVPEQSSIQQLLASAQSVYAQQSTEPSDAQQFALDVAV